MGFPHAIKAENYPTGLAILRLKTQLFNQMWQYQLKKTLTPKTTSTVWQRRQLGHAVRSSVTTLSVSPTSCCDNISQTTASVTTNRCSNKRQFLIIQGRPIAFHPVSHYYFSVGSGVTCICTETRTNTDLHGTIVPIFIILTYSKNCTYNVHTVSGIRYWTARSTE